LHPWPPLSRASCKHQPVSGIPEQLDSERWDAET
jgi:hypothetical protein